MNLVAVGLENVGAQDFVVGNFFDGGKEYLVSHRQNLLSNATLGRGLDNCPPRFCSLLHPITGFMSSV